MDNLTKEHKFCTATLSQIAHLSYKISLIYEKIMAHIDDIISDDKILAKLYKSANSDLHTSAKSMNAARNKIKEINKTLQNKKSGEKI